MLDVGPATAEKDAEDADLAVFVDRLAAAGSDRPTALARRQVREVIAAGAAPPGLRRLAESLAASVSELPPAPRRPSDDAGSVVSAMRSNGLVVLEDVDSAAVAAAVTALLSDGRRVIVTGSTLAEMGDVRHHLPADVVDRVLDQLPEVTPGELRELRTLLAMATPRRRARSGQELPDPGSLPRADEVARLCTLADRVAVPGSAVGMISALLAGLDRERFAAVTSVARCVERSLGGMLPRIGGEWAWLLLSDLIYGRHRAVFDQMMEDTAQAVAVLDRTREAPAVQVVAPLPDGSVDAILRYREFLASGGRSRAYFRAPMQREVQPVLRLLRVGGREPESELDMIRVLDHLELGDRLARVDAHCAEMGIPAPRHEADLNALTDGLVRVAAAARSVGALRHDVLFLAADSPLSVPDVDTAEQVARTVLEYAEHGSAAEAARTLDDMAADLAGRSPVSVMSPEHEGAVAAMRARDAAGYADALDALGAARRERQDEARQAELMARLGAVAPQLARAWAALGERAPSALSLACFVPIDALLSGVPAADTVDVVVVLGAARLGVERLLLTAVAPRMIAAVAPGERTDTAPTLLSVLQRASALVIRSRPAAGGGRVVPISAPAPRVTVAPVGQAGA